MSINALVKELEDFMVSTVIPAEPTIHHQLSVAKNRWTYPQVMRELRAEAKARGLWLFPLPERLGGRGLSLTEYAPLAERMNWSNYGPDIFNCYSGTISNATILDQAANAGLKDQYLSRLLSGEARSCISITEREVPSSDPTDLKFAVTRDGDDYVLNGVKSWATGATMDECEFILLLGATAPQAARHARHSLILVPANAPGLSKGRIETVMGFDDAPYGHCDLIFSNVRVPVTNRLGNEGEGFALVQATLGVGRIQLGMGCVGAAERALQEMCGWVETRVIGGRPLVERGVVMDAIARSRIEIDQARAFLIHTANLVQTQGIKAARSEVSQAKVLAPEMAVRVIDRAMQFHGGAGFSYDTPLAEMWAHQRTVRIGEGADEVHRELVGKFELSRQRAFRAASKPAAQ